MSDLADVVAKLQDGARNLGAALSADECSIALAKLNGAPAALVLVPKNGGLVKFDLEVAAKMSARQTIGKLRLARAELIFSYWQLVHNKPRAKFDPKDGRTRKLVQLQEKNDDDVSLLLYVVDGTLKDPNLMGTKKDSDRPYNFIETMFRDQAQVERLSDLGGYDGKTPHPIAVKYRALCLPHESAEQGALL